MSGPKEEPNTSTGLLALMVRVCYEALPDLPSLQHCNNYPSAASEPSAVEKRRARGRMHS